MEIKKTLPFVFLFLLLVTTPAVHAGAISDFLDSITAPVTRTFDAVHKFIIRIEIVGLNLVEVILFLVFILLLLALFIVPARVYIYARESAAPFRRFFEWVKK